MTPLLFLEFSSVSCGTILGMEAAPTFSYVSTPTVLWQKLFGVTD
jgi:hypothetical protein